MSPEYDMLDQLLGGDQPLAVIRQIFDDSERFGRAVRAMLEEDDVRLLEPDGTEAPRWRWREILADDPGARLSITKAGARLVGY